jgi:SAM-dependent MidA family methyltransferase
LIQSQFPDLTGQLLEVLPDGFIVEILSAASQWWADTATVLEAGRLLTFDYGGSDSELLMPERASGTLRAYREHRLSSDVLASPGEQDITAHVNFSVIQAAGEAAGLKTERFDSQAKFLTEVASAAWDGDSGLGGWTPQHTRQFQTLTHPDHLGRSFRVLVQYR